MIGAEAGDDQMRVSMLVDKPLPSDRPTGMGIAAFNMALALSKRGTKVHFMCRGNTNVSSILNDNLRVHRLRHYTRDNFSASLKLVSREQIDIFHLHSSSTLPSLLVAKAFGVKTLVHSHGVERLRLGRASMSRGIGMRACDMVAAVSESTKAGIIRTYHISPKKIEVVHNGVNLQDLQPARDFDAASRYGLEGVDRIILSIGSVHEAKGQRMIIECLPAILKAWPKVAYVNAGPTYDSSYERQLLARAETLRVTKSVRLLGSIPHQELMGLIKSADICVHPSLREGFPLAVLEEMALGKPVVASNIAAIGEVIDDRVDGVLVAATDTEAVADSILELLANPDLASKLGGAAMAKVSAKFTWDQTASRLEEIYRDLLR